MSSKANVAGKIRYVTINGVTYELGPGGYGTKYGTLESTQLFRAMPERTNDGCYAGQGFAAVPGSSDDYTDTVFYQFYHSYNNDLVTMERLNYSGELLSTKTFDIDSHANDACYDPVNDVIWLTGNDTYPYYYISNYSSTSPTITGVTPSASALNTYTGKIVYDEDTELFYTADMDGTTCTLYSFTISGSSLNTWTIQNQYTVTIPEGETDAYSNYYSYVAQGVCAFKGLIGLEFYRPACIQWYDMIDGSFAFTSIIPKTAGYGIPVGEFEAANIMEDGTMFMSFDSICADHCRVHITRTNILTGEAYAGEREISNISKTLYCTCSYDNATFYGYADGSAQHPFRLAQEAVFVADAVSGLATVQIVSDATTATTTGIFGTVETRKTPMTIGVSTSTVPFDLGCVDCLDTAGIRFSNCTFSPDYPGTLSYTFRARGTTYAGLDTCSFLAGHVEDSDYYASVSGESTVIIRDCDMLFDPDTDGDFYISAIPGVESYNTSYSGTSSTGVRVFYLNGGVLRLHSASQSTQRVHGDGYLYGAITVPYDLSLSGYDSSFRGIGPLLAPAAYTSLINSGYDVVTTISYTDDDFDCVYDNADYTILAVSFIYNGEFKEFIGYLKVPNLLSGSQYLNYCSDQNAGNYFSKTVTLGDTDLTLRWYVQTDVRYVLKLDGSSSDSISCTGGRCTYTISVDTSEGVDDVGVTCRENTVRSLSSSVTSDVTSNSIPYRLERYADNTVTYDSETDTYTINYESTTGNFTVYPTGVVMQLVGFEFT